MKQDSTNTTVLPAERNKKDELKTSARHHEVPFLVIQEGYGQTREFALDCDQLIIGRDPECGLPLNDRNVSRQHARIVREMDSFVIKDLSSFNGTFVNAQPVARSINAQLKKYILKRMR